MWSASAIYSPTVSVAAALPVVIVGAWQRWILLSVRSIRDWFPLCFRQWWKHKHTHTRTDRHTEFVCYIVVHVCQSGCMHVPRPTERDTLLDAGKSQTERDICQSLNGIFPMRLMRCSFSLGHGPALSLSHTHTRIFVHTHMRLGLRWRSCTFECHWFNGVLISYKTGSCKQIPQHVVTCWSISLSSFAIRVCLCDL